MFIHPHYVFRTLDPVHLDDYKQRNHLRALQSYKAMRYIRNYDQHDAVFAPSARRLRPQLPLMSTSPSPVPLTFHLFVSYPPRHLPLPCPQKQALLSNSHGLTWRSSKVSSLPNPMPTNNSNPAKSSCRRNQSLVFLASGQGKRPCQGFLRSRPCWHPCFSFGLWRLRDLRRPYGRPRCWRDRYH
jgi:hypothetical protein